MNVIRQLLLTAVLIAGVLEAQPSQAANWPQRTITLIQPFGAGGVTDRIGRVLAEFLSKELGVPVIVETKPGGGGSVGSIQVARAAPDGYTLLISGLASQVTSPLVTPNANIDTMKDFTHIAYLGGPPVVWAVTPSSGMKSVADVIDGAKKGTVTSFASPGTGTLGHLAAEMVIFKAGVEINHIPYNNQTLADILSGRVLLASTAWATAIGHIQGKTLTAVGVTSEGRLKAAPDVPTFKEQGYDVSAATWAALSGPAGLPPEIVTRLNELVAKFLRNQELLKPLEQDILEVNVMTPEQITTHFKNEIAVWTPVVANFLQKRK